MKEVNKSHKPKKELTTAEIQIELVTNLLYTAEAEMQTDLASTIEIEVQTDMVDTCKASVQTRKEFTDEKGTQIEENPIYAPLVERDVNKKWYNELI